MSVAVYPAPREYKDSFTHSFMFRMLLIIITLLTNVQVEINVCILFAAFPLVSNGYVLPQPPFFLDLPLTLQAQKIALGNEHVVLLTSEGTIMTWGAGRFDIVQLQPWANICIVF